MLRHGGKILIDQLVIEGVERVFCVPGESYLAALDGLHGSPIQTVVCRHEGGAAMMAEAHGKVTGSPGVAFVTRGPGATNASSGVHVAFQDSTPMVLFIGQVASDQRDREAFQEVDYRRMFAPLAKWVAEIDRVERIPEYVSQAFHVAMSGRPGPVVLALPEDMLSASATVGDVLPARPALPRATADDAARILEALSRSTKPFVVVGGSLWSPDASAALTAFAAAHELPVGAVFRRQDRLDNDHPCYVGDLGLGINPALAEKVKQSDLLLVLGSRLGEVATSSYSLIGIPDPGKPLIHVHVDADEIGRVYRPSLGIVATPDSMLAALNALPVPPAPVWREWTKQLRRDYEAWNAPQPTPGAVKMEAIVAHLSSVLPPDTIVTNGAGNFSAWLHRYHRYRRPRTQLAPTSGSMGYGLPAAVAAKLARPNQIVVCYAGDGDFQMTMQEFGTAVQYGANIVVIVCNNGMYGTIRMHQERHYPQRVSGTELVNPDFAVLARAYGAPSWTVTETSQFPEALEKAVASDQPALIELRLDPRALSPRLVLDLPDTN
jgi:Thiamine pyrophosphate-requiring enzymes [acetolactate synthase, pyruvate dehydrogenase (cytochrome), glyoxylate carboligase, phosphonopyruvate decarboxylase]